MVPYATHRRNHENNNLLKLVPEEQDIVVTPEYTLNFDNADAKISQFDLNAIEAEASLQQMTMR